ncbi:dynactin subunit protein [Rutstroemia sp. NJR-2017a WRK4]|nr:dynactin subunit protein [Rutstroemia sp. NJR-2017a WRK4]
MAALNRKYAALPDLTGIPRSQSASSSYGELDDDEDEKEEGISRSRLHPQEARSHFAPAQIDARDVDFSDRVTAKRKSYKTSTRRQRKDGTEEFGDFSDEEDGESLDRKLARLRREIEEVKEEYGKRNAEKNAADEDGKVTTDEDDITALSNLLDGISTDQTGQAMTAGAKLAKDLGTGIKASGPPQVSQGSAEPSTYTITYAPTYQQSHALAKAADFDGRLALLERVLGLNSTIDAGDNTKPIIPTLDILQRQVFLLTESTPSSLDSISRRVRTLTQEAERLEESRKNAKAAQDALRSAGGEVSGEDEEDSEQISKINALYGTLPTIENLAPLLPSLLDRLRSLRAIHADAATASENLDRVERKQADMANEIKKWREGLEKVEEVMKQGEEVIGGNMKVVEGWVKDLEEKMSKL